MQASMVVHKKLGKIRFKLLATCGCYDLNNLLLKHTCTSKRVGSQVFPTFVTDLPDNEKNCKQ